LPLDSIQQIQQCLGRERSPQQHDAIQKRFLPVRPPDGIRLIPPTVPEKLGGRISVQLFKRLLEDEGTIAEIGSEGNEASGHEGKQVQKKAAVE
jgi:hypothetical protein